ncbi:MAG: hypothetical protein EBW54_12930, partial [Betaproteobacteria bacterium]|nr:hypothetical protein [Betaproteobacteria bacterium]
MLGAFSLAPLAGFWLISAPCGNSMFCLRLPAILWALTWLAALGALARWFFPRHADAAQFFGGMVLMLSAGWLIEGRRLMLDLPVTACASLAY